MPLANLIQVEERAGPGTLNRYNRLRSITISANLGPETALGDALAFLEEVVRESFPGQAGPRGVGFASTRDSPVTRVDRLADHLQSCARLPGNRPRA